MRCDAMRCLLWQSMDKGKRVAVEVQLDTGLGDVPVSLSVDLSPQEQLVGIRHALQLQESAKVRVCMRVL